MRIIAMLERGQENIVVLLEQQVVEILRKQKGFVVEFEQEQSSVVQAKLELKLVAVVQRQGTQHYLVIVVVAQLLQQPVLVRLVLAQRIWPVAVVVVQQVGQGEDNYDALELVVQELVQEKNVELEMGTQEQGQEQV